MVFRIEESEKGLRMGIGCDSRNDLAQSTSLIPVVCLMITDTLRELPKEKSICSPRLSTS